MCHEGRIHLKPQERGPYPPLSRLQNMFYLKPPGACPAQAAAACCVTGREVSTEPMPQVTTATVRAQQKISSPSGGASDEWESVAPKKHHVGITMGTQQGRNPADCQIHWASKRCSVP